MVDVAEREQTGELAGASRPSNRAIGRAVAYAALPWAWFVVRDLHPRADVVAIGLPLVVLAAIGACVVLALVQHRRTPQVAAVSWALFGVVAIVGPWTPQPTGDPDGGVRIVASNVYGGRSEPEAVERDVLAAGGDVVVVSEGSEEVIEALSPHFEHRRSSRPHGRWELEDVTVFAEHPIVDIGLPDGIARLDHRGLRLRVDAPDQSFVLYALHLPPVRVTPSGNDELSAQGQQRLARRLVDAIEDESLPVVVAGDLNLVDRSRGYRMLDGVLDDAMRERWAGPTSLKISGRVLLARVDHVLVPPRWCAADVGRFDVSGSDHRGVVATVGRCEER